MRTESHKLTVRVEIRCVSCPYCGVAMSRSRPIQSLPRGNNDVKRLVEACCGCCHMAISLRKPREAAGSFREDHHSISGEAPMPKRENPWLRVAEVARLTELSPKVI